MKSAQWGGIFGLLGAGIILVGTLFAAAVYQGRSGEAYSPRNHFVSELGQLHVSSGAMLFNVGLIIGNVCLVPFTLRLARRFSGKGRPLFCVMGLLTNLAGGLVGVFPMNILLPHLLVAMIFFYACLASSAIFSVHALFVPSGPAGRWIAAPGLFTVTCFIVFLGETIRLRHHLSGVVHMLSHRPALWLLPASEWAVFLSVLLWIVLVALHLIIEDKRKAIR